jgi:hypothetical protein
MPDGCCLLAAEEFDERPHANGGNCLDAYGGKWPHTQPVHGSVRVFISRRVAKFKTHLGFEPGAVGQCGSFEFLKAGALPATP